MNNLESQSDYFIEDEFAVTAQAAISGGATFNLLGIIDRQYAEAEAGGINVESSTPIFYTAEEWAKDLTEGDTLTVPTLQNGEETPVAYAIRDIQPDGTGQTILILDET